MPRNGSGVYSLPAGNPVVPSTTIQSDWANSTLNDVADAVTGSLARDGTGGMSGALRLADGTITIPGIAFASETTTGFSRPTTNAIVASVSAIERVRINASGVSVTGALGVSSDVAVNTNKFNVTAASGNTAIAGTLAVTGLITAAGGVSGAVTSSSAAITGGSIDGTTIGATTASTGAFTTLSASSTVSGAGFSTYLASPPAIGGTVAAAGSFTTLSASTSVTTPSVTNAGTLALSATGANIVTASTNGSERLRIDASGNVTVGGGASVAGARSLTVTNTDSSASANAAFFATSNVGTMLFQLVSAAGGAYGYISTPAGAPNGLNLAAEGSNPVAIQTNGTERIRWRGDGSLWTDANAQPGFFARAWVNFDGTLSSPITPRSSANVSSVTKAGTGDYTINFATAMADANYSSVISTGVAGNSTTADIGFLAGTAPTSSALRIGTRNTSTGVVVDCTYTSVAIFR
jgi:hypothetical protein